MAICRDCGARIEFKQVSNREGRVYWKPSDPGGTDHKCTPSTNKENRPSTPSLSVVLPAAPPEEKWEGDKWDQLANQHLLGYVIRRMNHAKYGPRSTAILLEHKRAWAQQMREYAADNAIPADQGRAEWGGCMSRAETQIAHEKAQAKAQKQVAA